MFAMTQPSHIFTGHLGYKTIISSVDIAERVTLWALAVSLTLNT